MKKKKNYIYIIIVSILIVAICVIKPLLSYAFPDWIGGHNHDINVTPYIKKMFNNGDTVYFDVKTGLQCKESDYKPDNSRTGYNGLEDRITTLTEQNSCLKFYAFNDSEDSKIVSLILDHNTTATIVWNSNPDNYINGPLEARQQLALDTIGWSDKIIKPNNYYLNQSDKDNHANYSIEYTTNARFITSSEIAKITGNEDWDVNTSSDFYYFDSKTTTNSISCRQGNIAGCSYGWLYDRTTDCLNYGCNNEPINKQQYTEGYWTSDASINTSYNKNRAWAVYLTGLLDYATADKDGCYGIRPVIDVSKTLFTDFGTANEEDGVTFIKGGEEGIGPFATVTGSIEDGINTSANIEIDPNKISDGEKFTISLGLHSFNNGPVDGIPVEFEKISDKVHVSTSLDNNFDINITEKGIYTINWKLGYDENAYANVSLLQGDKKLESTGNINMDSTWNNEDIRAKYLWFENIDVANGLNLYSQVPKVKIDFIDNIIHYNDPYVLYQYTKIDEAEEEMLFNDIYSKGIKSHYVFVGFYEDSEFKHEFNWDNVIEDNKTVYLKFEEVPKVKLTFSNSSFDYSKYEKIYAGDKFENVTSLKAEIEAKAKENHFTFEGFYKDANFQTIEDFKNTFDEDTTIYLKFKEIPKITIKFINSLFTYNKSLEIYKGDIIPDSEIDAIRDKLDEEANKMHYSFGGFFEDNKFTKEIDFSKSINNNLDVYLRFVEYPVVNIKFTTDLFTLNKIKTLHVGDKLSNEELNALKEDIIKKARENHYTFEDFYLDSEFKTKADLTKTIDENITIYLKLKEIPKISISFESSVINNIDSLSIYKGDKIDNAKLEQIKENITKKAEDAGYIFEGIFLDEKFVNKLDITKEFTENTKVYLKLTKKSQEKEEEKPKEDPKTPSKEEDPKTPSKEEDPKTPSKEEDNPVKPKDNPKTPEENGNNSGKQEKENPKTGIVISAASLITFIAIGSTIYLYSKKRKAF